MAKGLGGEASDGKTIPAWASPYSTQYPSLIFKLIHWALWTSENIESKLTSTPDSGLSFEQFLHLLILMETRKSLGLSSRPFYSRGEFFTGGQMSSWIPIVLSKPTSPEVQFLHGCNEDSGLDDFMSLPAMTVLVRRL